MILKTIENDFLQLSLAESGAEMKHLVTKKNGMEWLWSADPDFWPRTAPILFPIVGKLAENQYLYHGKPFPLSQHGFARDRVFEISESFEDHIRFHFASDYETRKFYPFDFDLFVSYNLVKNWVWIDYEVVNKGKNNMYFSIGGHPGFALPGWPNKKYFLTFEEPDILEPSLLADGLLKKEKAGPILMQSNELLITSELFENDALVFDKLRSSWVGFRSFSDDHNLNLHFSGFPQLGIWSKPGAPFVCIEPWYGHADYVGKSGEIKNKPGIIKLEQNQNFHCRYAIEILNY